MPAKLLIECSSIYDKFDSVGAAVDNNGSYVIGSLPGRGRLYVPGIAQNHAVIWVQQNGVSLVLIYETLSINTASSYLYAH